MSLLKVKHKSGNVYKITVRSAIGSSSFTNQRLKSNFKPLHDVNFKGINHACAYCAFCSFYCDIALARVHNFRGRPLKL